MMDKIQNLWSVGFDNGDYTIARVFPNGSNYKSVEKKHKDDIVFSDQGSSTYNLSFNIDRQAYESYDERRQMLKRAQPRKQSWIKTSVKPLCLPSTARPM